MIDIRDRSHIPSLEEIGEYIQNSLFMEFCSRIKAGYNAKEQIAFSSCSWEHGWNVKFKKSGKALCTVYPRETYFTVLVVVGQKEKEGVEIILDELHPVLKSIYRETKEGNGQRWLMIDLEDHDKLYEDVFRLIDVRKNAG